MMSGEDLGQGGWENAGGLAAQEDGDGSFGMVEQGAAFGAPGPPGAARQKPAVSGYRGYQR